MAELKTKENDASVEAFLNTIPDENKRKESFAIDMSDAPDDGLTLARHFLDCLDGTAKPLMTVRQAAKHMEILFKILEASVQKL